MRTKIFLIIAVLSLSGYVTSISSSLPIQSSINQESHHFNKSDIEPFYLWLIGTEEE